MALFPFFVDIEKKEGLIIGGGKHALEKIQRLLAFSPCLKVIAPEVCPAIKTLADEVSEGTVTLIKRNFQESDLDEWPAFVIVAGDDPEENHRISDLCRERHILVNVVDDQSYCEFVFPSLIVRGDLSVGICTNGASPGTGVLLRQKMEKQIPDHIGDILDYLREMRPEVTRRFAEKKKRFGVYYLLSEQCMEKDRPLAEDEFEALLQCVQETEGE